MSVKQRLKGIRSLLFELFTEDDEAPEDRGRAFAQVVEDCAMFCEQLGYDLEQDTEGPDGGGAEEGPGVPDQAAERHLPGSRQAGRDRVAREAVAEFGGDEEAPDDR